MSTIRVTEASIEKAVEVNQTIVEFGEPYAKNYFEDRYGDREHLIIIGYADEQPAGYLIGYDRDQDGSFYCWMAGVDPAHRRQGVLSALMAYQAAWSKSHGYTKIKIKTRNNRREMLANLVKKGYLFTDVVPSEDAANNRISLEKPL